MKTKNILLLAGAILLAGACVKEARNPMLDAIPATISVAIPEEGLSKVALTQDVSSIKLTWESTDAITVKNADNESQSVEFTYLSGAGTKSARFSAADITPLAGASSYNIYLNCHMPDGFASQTQTSNASTAHLGYAASVSDVDVYDGVTFSEAWASANGGSFASSSVLKITAEMPTAEVADAVQKVTIKSSNAIFAEEKELSIAITNPGVEGSGKVVTVYATLPSGNVALPNGTEFVFQFQLSDDVTNKYTAYRKLGAAATLNGGQVNSFNLECPDIASFAGKDDDGTEAKPYLIGDRHQLNKMRDELENGKRKYFKLIDDVDLSQVTSWEPVNESADYQIDFNGAGHAISHLTIDGTSTSNAYSGFFGMLHGNVHDVIFDEANVNGGNKNSGIVIGRSGASSKAADFRNVTVQNSTLTSSNNYVGGLAGYIKKCNSIANCHVVNTSITSTVGNVNPSLVGGLVAEMAPNGGSLITDSSAENVTISGGCTNADRSGVGGLIGRINAGNVSILRCHSTGTLAPSNANNVGGLVGSVNSGSGSSISNSYSTCQITRGYTYVGGLVGKCAESVGLTINHCFASGKLSLKGGYGGKGGLVGVILGTGVTIQEGIAWNASISGGHDTSDQSSGAVAGYTHPNCVLTDNYRKPGMTFSGFYWAPSANFDHANVNGTTAPLKINTSGNEGSLTDGTASDFAASGSKKYYAYHGKHLPNTTTVTPHDKYGWTASPAIEGIDEPVEDDPENPAYTGNNVWAGMSSGTTKTLRPGVEWTTFHGTWQGDTRHINIIRTTVDANNHLGVFYDYTTEGRKYLDEKCEYLTAVAGTNGSMACCHFVRVNDVVKHDASSQNEWINNCALTIDGNDVDIVKVASNYDAATLPNHTVSCAGPLLVWKGNKLVASDEWKAADTSNWLGDTNPRTAIGILKDGKTVIQVTVDGRWTSSDPSKRAIGMSTDLLAELMLELGCYKAMNLDGGGGTQMWVSGEGDIHNMVNHPHNSWPTYGTEPAKYYWIKDNEVGRRATGSAIYIY